MKKRTASQVGRMSRRKGKSFERWCANYFTNWTGLKWESTRNSGRTDLKGDIYCVSRPDLQLVIECKHRKEYSIHAMLKPTKAFNDMVRHYQSFSTIIIIKNETGVWFSCPPSVLVMVAIPNIDKIRTKNNGVWVRLQHISKNFTIDGVEFDGRRMEAAGCRS